MTNSFRWPALLVSGLLATVAAGLFLRRGEVAAAVIAAGAQIGIGAFLAFSRSELATAANSGPDADERQREINRQAILCAYVAVAAVAIPGLFVEIARGRGPGPFALICAVGGLTHMLSLLVLRRRM